MDAVGVQIEGFGRCDIAYSADQFLRFGIIDCNNIVIGTSNKKGLPVCGKVHSTRAGA